MKIGIIGCGAIGSLLAGFIDEKLEDNKLVALCDIDVQKAEQLSNSLRSRPAVMGYGSLIESSDLIIEAAAPDMVADILRKCIDLKKHLMVMSVGGLLPNMDLLPKLTARLFIPSGAVCGIDGVKAANIEQITSAKITTTKAPLSLLGAPYIRENKIDLKKIKKAKVIFTGTALEATKAFPKNINVSAILSLAGIGASKTRVEIVVDPNIKTNTHKIEVVGTFGKLTTITENIKSPLNPKTSHMAVLSACATLKRLVGNIKIGN